MGNVCFDKQNLNKRKRPNRRSYLAPTKFYNPNSKLKLELFTWLTQDLPNLRNDKKVLSQQYIFDQEGQLMISEKTNEILFIPEGTPNNEKQIFQTDFTIGRDLEKTLSANLFKTQNGFLLNFTNQIIYELIVSPRQIVEGDKILIGGTEYNFLKYIDDPKYVTKNIQKVSENADVQTRDYMESYSDVPEGNPTCRICMSEQVQKQNPLICPCHCTGSVKYFHLKCWTSWSFSSQISHEGLYIGNIVKEQCQLCKTNLIADRHYRQKTAALLSSVAKVKTPFIVMEGLRPLEDFPYYKDVKLNFLILSFADKKKYSIGRGNQVDIPLEIDCSISRKNTTLEFKSGKIYIEDMGSKHGTYILVRNPVIIRDDSPKFFVYKNNLLSVSIE